MYRLFHSKRIHPEEEHLLERLKKFVTELDTQISDQCITIINAPERFPLSIQRRNESLYAYHSTLLTSLEKTPAYRVKVSNAILFSRTPVGSEKDTINLCSREEIREYCVNLAHFVMTEKGANCFGLCALALYFSGQLIANNDYQYINVEICHLFHWDHVLIKLSLGSHCLFYDPWWQRCPSLDPHPNIFIEKNYFDARMQRLLDNAEAQWVQTICHFNMLEHRYNERTNRLEIGGILLNADYDSDYCILCGLNSFSNPSQLISARVNALDESYCVIS